MVHENCGVIGFFSLNGHNVIPYVIDSLRALQHRGQEAWGFAVPSKPPYKRLGLVSTSRNFKSIVRKYSSHAAIGHVRYSTFGKSNLENAQPLKIKDLCIAHNGTIANVEELSNMVGGCTFSPQTMTDTLLAAQRLMMHLEKNDNMIQAMRVLKEEMIGSFCFTLLTDDGSVYAVRDTRGFRPLVLGYIEETNTYMISSESCAIDTVDGKLLGDIQPGELLKISSKGIKRQQFSTSEYHSHCAFEFTYFAHPSSTIEGVNVYEARKKMGHYLARKYPVKDADVVIPVPDSARPAALGYAEELGIHFEEGLLKDRYRKKGSMRSFIEPYHGERIEINKGIVPIPEVIRGKNVVVIDDSIVRGTSSQSIIKILRSAGASKISLIVTFPPIKYPCYAGIDFPSQDELLAFQNQNNENDDLESEIAKSLGADKVIYNDTVTLAQAIGIDERELCFSCSNGNYKPLGIKPVFKTRAEVKGDLEN
ncbi:MAG: amidophosphoribosyltransferase [Thermoproteota archaeon]|nr:amidophosphoribosyltransferase [Thermoproteota archaeon]